MRATQRVILPLLIGLLALHSCAPLTRPDMERTHYLLGVQRPDGGGESSPLNRVLALRPLRVAPGYDGKAFITIGRNGRVQADFHNQFFLPPGELLTGQVRQWLTDARLFSHVTDLGSLVPPDLILEGFVPTLFRDAASESARAVLAVQFLLLQSGRETSPAIVLQRDYRRELDLKGFSPRELVQGWDAALHQIMIEFESDLRHALQTRSSEMFPDAADGLNMHPSP